MSDTEIKSQEALAAEPVLGPEAEIVKNLSNRDIKWRAKAKELRSELETEKARSETQIKQTEEKIKVALKSKEQTEGRWMQAQIIGLKEVIADFKAKKPAFFGDEKKISTSTNASMPAQAVNKPKSAHDLTPEEWDKNRSRYMSGKF
jgi:hypothetical protein